MTLEHAMRDDDVMKLIERPGDNVRLLWDVCQVPDYRKIAPANHAELVATLFRFHGAQTVGFPTTGFAKQVAYRRPDGGRYRHARQPDRAYSGPGHSSPTARTGSTDPAHWQGVTRDLEDRLSDALHDRLTQRFVDRRTSVLMRRLRENAMLEAEITD